jgi:hypothetical protein
VDGLVKEHSYDPAEAKLDPVSTTGKFPARDPKDGSISVMVGQAPEMADVQLVMEEARSHLVSSEHQEQPM